MNKSELPQKQKLFVFNKFDHLKLKNKFFILFTGFVILVIIFVSAAVFYFQRQMLLRQAQEKAFSLTHTLAYSSLNAILQNDYIVIQMLIDSMIESADIASIALLDTTGRVIAADKPESRGHRFTDQLTYKALASDTYHIQNIELDKGKELWDTAVPIFHLNRRIATARITYSMQEPYQGLMKTILGIGIVALFLSLLLAYKISQSISKPILDAAGLAEEYGKGNFDAHIPNYSEDEIGQLVKTLNRLSKELHNLLDEKIANEGLIMIGEFAAFIIHDLKNPINGIHLLADGLHRRTPNDSPLKKYAAEILLASQRVEDFIKRTLDISKSTILNMQSIQINEIIEDAVQQIQMVSTHLSRNYDQNMPEIPGDYAMLLMALKNLLINAMEAIVDHGAIFIETLWRGKAIIKISDTGIGIAKDRLTTIFRPFFSMKEQGHGLGLAMVRRAVILHRGSIEVESEEGVGSTFTIMLPGDGVS
jgi:signal transduction histidine kinase